MIAAAAGLAFLGSVAATPLASRLAHRLGATDVPDPRRIHRRPTPRGGGVAVAAAVATSAALSVGVTRHLGPPVLAGAGVLLVIGIVDDVVSLRPATKLAGQLLAALLAVMGGLQLRLLTPAAAGGVLGAFDPGLTVLWIVFVTNALNLSDGLDGLASGIAAIALLWLAATALVAGDPAAALPAIVVAGALAGFLLYNFSPATVFLGDAGSLLLGYAVAVLPLAGVRGAPLPPLAAFLLVAPPATDTLLAVARRFLARCLPAWGAGLFWRGVGEGLRNTVQADRRHVHHRLLDLGFAQRRAVLLLYLAGASSGALAFAVVTWPGWPVDLIALALGLGMALLVQALGFDELQLARSGLVLPVLDRLARRRWLVVAVDALLVCGAFAGARGLAGRPGLPALAAIAAVAIVQLGIFAALGAYRTAWRTAGVAEFGLLLRACAGGALGAHVVLRMLGLSTGGAATALAFFLLLLAAVTVRRFAYPLLAHAARRASSERALLCANADQAPHVVARLRAAGPPALEPIGVVELEPGQPCGRPGTLPVLGRLDSLAAILRHRRVQHLVVADPTVRGEVLTWTRAVCRQSGVRVHHYVETLIPDDALADEEAGRAGGVPRRANGRAPANGNGVRRSERLAATNGNGAQVPVRS